MNKVYHGLDKILVVTSSLELQKELRTILDNYLVLFVENDQQAIEKLSTAKDISAVLVGIFLEKTQGFRLLDFFKNNKDFYKGPVLVITDTISDSVINKVENYDIFDFIVRYSNNNIIQIRLRNAIMFYSEKRKLLTYAVEQIYQKFSDAKLLIALLAQIVEFKNFESGAHTENVSNITRILCKQLVKKYPDKYQFINQDIEYISLAASLHDIGKIYIPDHILNKPSKLTKEEKEIMKEHTIFGGNIIDRLYKFYDRPIIKYARDICLYHHERIDGKGYPNHLKGGQIPIWAQIVSVADCYDALTSDRVYRPAVMHAAALSMIDQGDCGKFSPDIIEALWDCEEEINNAKKQVIPEDLTKESISLIVEDICKIK